MAAESVKAPTANSVVPGLKSDQVRYMVMVCASSNQASWDTAILGSGKVLEKILNMRVVSQVCVKYRRTPSQKFSPLKKTKHSVL
jgi:hypothetical protein